MLSLGYVVGHPQLSPRNWWESYCVAVAQVGWNPTFNPTSISATSEDCNPSSKFAVASYAK